jgi:hypothetical protein
MNNCKKMGHRYPTLAPPFMRSRQCVVVSLSFIFSVFILLGIFHPTSRSTVVDFVSPAVKETPVAEIPNIIHYVHILPPAKDGKSSVLEFKFRHFLSVYSAYLYVRPDTIYIHTNAGPDIIQQAKESSNQWTRAIANLPSVEFHFEEAPTHTSKGLKIVHFANRADFIRTRVVQKMGGIYIDEDIYLIKNLTGLRRSGFQSVVGRQQGGQVCNAMFMAMPGSDLVTAFYDLQDSTFDGGWTTHGVELLTRLVAEFSAREHEVLIMEQSAFFSYSWEEWGVKAIYETHNWDKKNDKFGLEEPLNFNLTNFIKSFELRPASGGRADWRASYAVHGWNSQTGGREWLFGDFGGITLKYISARNSNFARALYPAMKHALDAGVIKDE